MKPTSYIIRKYFGYVINKASTDIMWIRLPYPSLYHVGHIIRSMQ